MIFRPRQKNQQTNFKIVVNNRELIQTKEIAFLGVILDERVLELIY